MWYCPWVVSRGWYLLSRQPRVPWDNGRRDGAIGASDLNAIDERFKRLYRVTGNILIAAAGIAQPLELH